MVPGGAEADTPRDDPCSAIAGGQPVLAGGSQRKGRGGDAEDGGGEVVVAAVEAPDAAVVIAGVHNPCRTEGRAAGRRLTGFFALAWPLISKSK